MKVKNGSSTGHSQCDGVLGRRLLGPAVTGLHAATERIRGQNCETSHQRPASGGTHHRRATSRDAESSCDPECAPHAPSWQLLMQIALCRLKLYCRQLTPNLSLGQSRWLKTGGRCTVRTPSSDSSPIRMKAFLHGAQSGKFPAVWRTPTATAASAEPCAAELEEPQPVPCPECGIVFFGPRVRSRCI